MALISLLPDPISAALISPLVIVIPIYNEAANIKQVVSDWEEELDKLSLDFQFLLLNDGSRDETVRVLGELEAANPRRFVIVEKMNSGHGRTCRLGYAAAVAAPSVEWILQIDSDGQCNPAYFPEFWSRREKADCIFGVRTQRDDGAARAIMSKVCRLGSTVLGGVDLIDPNVPYRLMRQQTLRSALADIPASFDIHNVAVTFVLKRNPAVRWQYVPIRFLDRQGGNNSINILNVAHLGVSMLFDLAKLKK